MNTSEDGVFLLHKDLTHKLISFLLHKDFLILIELLINLVAA
jgi:hypothetical protein